MPKLAKTPSEATKKARPPKTTATHARGRGKSKKTVWEPPPLVESGEGDVVVSYSELSTYRSCPLKHYLEYKERWTKPPEEMSPLNKGTLWHYVMEIHYLGIQKYQRGEFDRAGLHEWVSQRIALLLWDQDTGEQSEVQELVTWMYQGHIEKWGLDDQWDILGVEVKFQQRVPAPDESPSPFILKGKLDLVVRERSTGKIWIVDHKSGSNLPVEEDLDMADQFALYIWLMQSAGVPVLGAIHSANRTTRNAGDRPENQDPETGEPLRANQKKQTLDQRMKRTLLARGARELQNIARDAWATAVNAYPEALGYTPLPIYSNPDTLPFTWRGEWREVYLMSRKGRDIHAVLQELGFVQNFERH